MRGYSRTGNTRQGDGKILFLSVSWSSPSYVLSAPLLSCLSSLLSSLLPPLSLSFPSSTSPSPPGGCCHCTYYEDEENTPSQPASVRVHWAASIPCQGKSNRFSLLMTKKKTIPLMLFLLFLPSLLRLPPSSPPSSPSTSSLCLILPLYLSLPYSPQTWRRGLKV